MVDFDLVVGHLQNRPKMKVGRIVEDSALNNPLKDPMNPSELRLKELHVEQVLIFSHKFTGVTSYRKTFHIKIFFKKFIIKNFS